VNFVRFCTDAANKMKQSFWNYNIVFERNSLIYLDYSLQIIFYKIFVILYAF